jgi:hypothetical protein
MKRSKKKALYGQILAKKKAIKAYCYECQQAKKIDCGLFECKLYGHRPFKRARVKRLIKD